MFETFLVLKRFFILLRITYKKKLWWNSKFLLYFFIFLSFYFPRILLFTSFYPIHSFQINNSFPKPKNGCSWKFCICCGSNNCCKFFYRFIFLIGCNILNFQTIECPIAIKWIISKEKLAALKDSDNGYLSSKGLYASNIPGVQYYLSIYPNGNKERHRGRVSIYLCVDIGNESKVKVDGKFCIESNLKTRKLNFEYRHSGVRGGSPCTIADFLDSTQKFIVNGKFILTFKGILSVDKEQSNNANEINLGTAHLGPLFWMNEDKDFTINVGENSVKASFNYLHYFTMLIYKFRSINRFFVFIPLYFKLCSILDLKKRKKTKWTSLISHSSSSKLPFSFATIVRFRLFWIWMKEWSSCNSLICIKLLI